MLRLDVHKVVLGLDLERRVISAGERRSIERGGWVGE